MKKFKLKKIKVDKSDLFLYAGALVICGGVGMMHIPAAVILLGVFLIVKAFAEIK